MTNDIEVQDWYQSLVDDCRAIMTEAVFNSRWELLAGYHAVGKRISTENNLNRKDIYGKKILKGLSKSIEMSERNLYSSIQFYKKYPDLSKLPDGKNASWTKVLKLLPEPPEPETPALPDGKYRVIYADPPWLYNKGEQFSLDGPTVILENEYNAPPMSIEALCDLPIKELSQENAVLFLWVTSPLLEECFSVINSWGFKYKASVVWNKDAHNVGHYVSVRHELLLICTRGSCLPDIDTLFPSVVTEKRGEHSVKPETFRKMIDAMYPKGKRVELFARREVMGWDVWGLDVN